MMRAIILLACTFFVMSWGYCAEPEYSFTAIPPILLKNANVVKRMEKEEMEYVQSNLAVYRIKYAITILNENGDDAADIVLWYDKFNTISNFEGNLYDAFGNQIRKLKSKEVIDESAVSAISIMEDNRVKKHNFYYKTYPYTIEYSYEITMHQTMYFYGWEPQSFPRMSVQNSSYSFIAPSNYKVRYKAVNFKGVPTVTTEKGKKVMTWSADTLMATSLQYAAPKWKELAPKVYIGPSDFEIEGYKGNMTNWQEFGRFVYNLKKDRDALPPAMLQKIAALTAGISSDKEKVHLLYQYLQQNTRYISVQLGIGGWQPFDAHYVSQNGYGDCKALSNYMYSLLKAAGISSYYALIRAGSDKKIEEDFPIQQFNHAILCVPVQNDTIWLECTSQTESAGYMGDFTGNRKALLIDENGGHLVSTPRYGLAENIMQRKVKGSLNEEGNLLATVNTTYSGMQQDHLSGRINHFSKDKLKEILNEELAVSTYNVNQFSYTEIKDKIPKIEELLEIEVSKFATKSGKRLFIAPNLLSHSHIKINGEEERQYNFVFQNEYRNIDSVDIEIPDGYTVEAMPAEMDVKTKWGHYKTGVSLKQNALTFYRLFEQFEGTFPPSDAAELAKFYADIYKADRSKVVLVKKEN